MNNKNIILLILFFCLCGCRPMSERVSRKLQTTSANCRANWYADHKYFLNDEKLEQITFEGSIVIEDVNVTYQAGLENQANCLAHQVNDLIRHVEDITGIEIEIATQVYLLRVDKIPTGYDMSFNVDPNVFAIPLFVEAGREECEAIIAENTAYPVLYMHEITEMSLIFRKSPGAVLPDASGQVFVFKPKLVNYTRWLREGLSNYAGYLAYRRLRPQLDEQYPSARWAIYNKPFTALSKVREKLFDWHQYSNSSLNDDYYNAAMGLILLIEHRFGQDSIKRITEKMYQEDYLDGKDLIRIVNDVLGVDIVKMAEQFEFPQIGLKSKIVGKSVALNERLNVDNGLYITAIDPDSIWQNGNIQVKDVIVKLGNRIVSNDLDLELAIFESLDNQTVDATIWRREIGQTTTKLHLNPEAVLSGK